MTFWEVFQVAITVMAAVALVFVLRARHRSYYRFLDEFSDKEVCEHLRGALEMLKSRGHRVVRAGQVRPDFPLEIHISPPFDLQRLADELKLKEPVFVSERKVLCCREDECEIRPVE